jgi:hypothetical protein
MTGTRERRNHIGGSGRTPLRGEAVRERDAQMVALHADGKSHAQIAAELGVTKCTVSGALHRHNLREGVHLPPISRSASHKDGNSLIDPNRADKLLRKFTWDAAK